MFELNAEEKGVLQAIKGFADKGEKLDYYKLVNSLHYTGDTSALIPVVGRLEDDGYITSDGWIYRYIHLTDKGRREAEAV